MHSCIRIRRTRTDAYARATAGNEQATPNERHVNGPDPAARQPAPSMVSRKKLRSALLGLACATILFSTGLIVGYALWSSEQEPGFMRGFAEGLMFLPLAIGLLVCGGVEAARRASKLPLVITTESATPGLPALICAASLRTILGAFALLVFGLSAGKRTRPSREVEGGFGLSNDKSTTYGQPSWTLILICLTFLGVTSVLAVVVEVVLFRDQQQQQAQLAQQDSLPALSAGQRQVEP